MYSGTGKKIILLVEDNEDHAFLIKKALRACEFPTDIRIVDSGEAALDYIFQRGEFANPQDAPSPDLIILDINLPGISGFEVLRAVKGDAKLRIIPVCMLTTSKQDSDLKAGYENGANSFVQKPADFNEFVDRIKDLGFYWLLTNIPPTVAV